MLDPACFDHSCSDGLRPIPYGLDYALSRRISRIHWIATGVEIFMQGLRIKGVSVQRVAAEEPSGSRVVVSGAEVVEA